MEEAESVRETGKGARWFNRERFGLRKGKETERERERQRERQRDRERERERERERCAKDKQVKRWNKSQKLLNQRQENGRSFSLAFEVKAYESGPIKEEQYM